MHKQLSRLNPLKCSDGNKRFSMCHSSTCIGANDSHTVLTKNSFGATSKESPKASLDDYLNMYRMVSPGSEMQVWISNLHKMHCIWLQEHKWCPQSYDNKCQRAGKLSLNNNAHVELKTTGWFQYNWEPWARHHKNLTSLTTVCWEESISQKWPWWWSIGQRTFQRGIFGGGLWLQRSTARAIANLVSRSCFACILVQHFAQYA